MTKRERLKHLIAWLESPFVDKEHFSMEDWPQCALAEAAKLPKLQRDGLERTDEGEGKFRGMTRTSAAVAFFGLTWRRAHQIFGNGKPRQPKTVAKQLRTTLKTILIVTAFSLLGCATRFIQDVYVNEQTHRLYVKECLLESAEALPETCVVRQYDLR